MRLVLWDIDGTLLRAGPVASEIFGATLAAVTGRDPGDHGVVMSGRTDPQIAAEILGTVGIGEDEALTHVPAVLDELTVQLAANVDRIRREGRVLPGGIPAGSHPEARQPPVCLGDDGATTGLRRCSPRTSSVP